MVLSTANITRSNIISYLNQNQLPLAKRMMRFSSFRLLESHHPSCLAHLVPDHDRHQCQFQLAEQHQIFEAKKEAKTSKIGFFFCIVGKLFLLCEKPNHLFFFLEKKKKYCNMYKLCIYPGLNIINFERQLPSGLVRFICGDY